VQCRIRSTLHIPPLTIAWREAMKALATQLLALLLAASAVQRACAQTPPAPPTPLPITIPPGIPAPPPVAVPPVDINNPAPPPGPITIPVTPPVAIGNPAPPPPPITTPVTPPVALGNPSPPSPSGSPAAAPEPASIVSALVGAGLASVVAWRRRMARST
jgi:hypothetical protein